MKEKADCRTLTNRTIIDKMSGIYKIKLFWIVSKYTLARQDELHFKQYMGHLRYGRAGKPSQNNCFYYTPPQ